MWIYQKDRKVYINMYKKKCTQIKSNKNDITKGHSIIQCRLGTIKLQEHKVCIFCSYILEANKNKFTRNQFRGNILFYYMNGYAGSLRKLYC